MRRLILVTVAALLAAVSAYAGSDGFLKGKVLRIDKETVAEVGSEGSPFDIDLPIPGVSIGGGSKLSLLDVELAIKQAADRVFLHPKGNGSLNGLSSTQYFLKDRLDTLGVEVKLFFVATGS